MRGVFPVLCALVALLFLTGASGYISVPANNMFSARNSKGRQIGCAVVKNKVISGKISARGFLPDTAAVKTLKAKLKKEKNPKKRSALSKKIKTANNTAKANAASCSAELRGDPTPTPNNGNNNPPPMATRTPTPRATATPSSGACFDSQGNTTRFGIPSNVPGNISRGSNVWNSRCQSCHGERTNRNFGQISTSMSLPQMMGLGITVQQLADLTAYLNRNNTQCR